MSGAEHGMLRAVAGTERVVIQRGAFLRDARVGALRQAQRIEPPVKALPPPGGGRDLHRAVRR